MQKFVKVCKNKKCKQFLDNWEFFYKAQVCQRGTDIESARTKIDHDRNIRQCTAMRTSKEYKAQMDFSFIISHNHRTLLLLTQYFPFYFSCSRRSCVWFTPSSLGFWFFSCYFTHGCNSLMFLYSLLYGVRR